MDSAEIDVMDMNITRPHFEPPSYYVTIPAILIGFVAFILDLIVIFLIFKCKELQTISNWYILNWRICSVLYLALSPNFYTHVFSIYEVEVSIYRVWQGEMLVLFTGIAIFVTVIHLDWYLLNYAPAISMKTRRYFKINVGLIWIIVIILSVYICLNSVLKIMDTWIFSVLTVCILIYCLMQIIRLFKQKESSGDCNVNETSNLILFLVTSYFVCCFGVYVVHTIIFFDPDRKIADEIYVGMQLIRSLNSIFVFALMYHFEADFKSNFKKLFCCKSELGQSQKSYPVEA